MAWLAFCRKCPSPFLGLLAAYALMCANLVPRLSADFAPSPPFNLTAECGPGGGLERVFDIDFAQRACSCYQAQNVFNSSMAKKCLQEESGALASCVFTPALNGCQSCSISASRSNSSKVSQAGGRALEAADLQTQSPPTVPSATSLGPEKVINLGEGGRPPTASTGSTTTLSQTEKQKALLYCHCLLDRLLVGQVSSSAESCNEVVIQASKLPSASEGRANSGSAVPSQGVAGQREEAKGSAASTATAPPVDKEDNRKKAEPQSSSSDSDDVWTILLTVIIILSLLLLACVGFWVQRHFLSSSADTTFGKKGTTSSLLMSAKDINRSSEEDGRRATGLPITTYATLVPEHVAVDVPSAEARLITSGRMPFSFFYSIISSPAPVVVHTQSSSRSRSSSTRAARPL